MGLLSGMIGSAVHFCTPSVMEGPMKSITISYKDEVCSVSESGFRIDETSIALCTSTRPFTLAYNITVQLQNATLRP